MNEKKLNMFAREEEYAALRNFIKIVENSGEGGMAASVKRYRPRADTPPAADGVHVLS